MLGWRLIPAAVLLAVCGLTLNIAEAVEGNPARGEELFTGMTAFTKGGAPCLACHGIAGAGLGHAAGANYGPDLTAIHGDYGAETLLSILADLPFPSMEALYVKRPLTETEQADLTAYMGSVSGSVAPIGGTLALHTALALVALFAVTAIFGRKRLRGVRKTLIKNAQNKKEAAR